MGDALEVLYTQGFNREELFVQTKFTPLGGQDPLNIPYDKEIRSFCLANNIRYQSFWTLTANPHILESRELFDLGRKYDKNVIQILFAYLHQRGITPLTGTSDLEHMQNDLQSFDISLEKNEKLKLDILFE